MMNFDLLLLSMLILATCFYWLWWFCKEEDFDDPA